MNIFVRELKANLKSLLIWSVIVILFTLVGVSKFSAYANNPDMLALINALPQAMQSALDLQSFNLTTISGFAGVMYPYTALLLSIAAAMWGSDIISKEERDKTVEFSLTLPVTRSRVVTAKALAALVNCVALLLVTWGAMLVSATQYHPDSSFFRFLSLTMLAYLLTEAIFLAIGIFLGCAMKQYRRASSLAVSVLLGTYFLSILAAMRANLKFLKYLTPFKYFDAGTLLRESKFDLVFVGLSLAIIVASMAGAYVMYSKRDLYI